MLTCQQLAIIPPWIIRCWAWSSWSRELFPLLVLAWVISSYRQRNLAQQAGRWSSVEATIESGVLEGTRETGRVILPTFAFSYQVSEDRYSGRFSLRANVSKTLAASMIDQMIGRKILLRYDPEQLKHDDQSEEPKQDGASHPLVPMKSLTASATQP